MGTYNIQDSPLSQYIYGFGTSSSVNSFPTSIISQNLKINGQSARGVPRDPVTMPFSTVSFGGYQLGGDSTWFSAFAQEGRFIEGNTQRVVKSYSNSYSSNDKIPVFYKKSSLGLFGHSGTLYIGGSSSSDIVSNQCPPVVLFAFQACGGNSGNSVSYTKPHSGTAIVEGSDVYATGGGGGAGAFLCFQVDLSNTLGSSINLIFKYQIKDKNILIYDKNDSLIASVNGGSNGSDGYISNNNTIANRGNGGVKGRGIVYSLPSGFSHVYDNVSQSGDYGNGGRGEAFTRLSGYSLVRCERGKSSKESETGYEIKLNTRTDSQACIKGGYGGIGWCWAEAFRYATGGGGGSVLGGFTFYSYPPSYESGSSDLGSTGYGFGGEHRRDALMGSVAIGGDHAVVVYW